MGPTIGRVNLLRRRIEISEALSEVNSKFCVVPPKTWESRTIAIPPFVADARADDRQLHTHVVVGNHVRGVGGVWLAIDGRFLYQHKLAVFPMLSGRGSRHRYDHRREHVKLFATPAKPVRNSQAPGSPRRYSGDATNGTETRKSAA